MFGSTTHTIRRLAGMAVAAGALAAFVPVASAGNGFQGSPDAFERAAAAHLAQVGSDFQGSPDAFDRAVATRQVEAAAAFDAREHAQLRVTQPVPDVIERAAIAQQRYALRDLSVTPKVVDSQTTSSRFDWSDFGIGAGAGIGLMLLLLGLGVSVRITRQGEREVSSI